MPPTVHSLSSARRSLSSMSLRLISYTWNHPNMPTSVPGRGITSTANSPVFSWSLGMRAVFPSIWYLALQNKANICVCFDQDLRSSRLLHRCLPILHFHLGQNNLQTPKIPQESNSHGNQASNERYAPNGSIDCSILRPRSSRIR